jgi:hypothetical protein
MQIEGGQSLTPTELTEKRIAEAMACAEKAACGSGNLRCFALPDPVDEVRKTCTPKGRCLIGWIVAEGGRTSYDVWLDRHTGKGRLRRRVD